MKGIKKTIALLLVLGLVLQGVPMYPAYSQDRSVSMRIGVGESQILPTQILQKITIVKPEVLDVTPLSETEIMIIGKAPGDTMVYLFTDTGRVSYGVEVFEEEGGLQKRIRNLLGIDSIDVVSDQGAIFVKGTVTSKEQKEQVNKIAKKFYGDRVVDLMTIGAVGAKGPAKLSMARQTGGPSLDKLIAEEPGTENIEITESIDEVMISGVVDDPALVNRIENIVKRCLPSPGMRITNLIKVEQEIFSLEETIMKSIDMKGVSVRLLYQGGRLPKDQTKIDPEKLTVILEGTVTNGAMKQKAEEISTAYNKKVLNHLIIAEPQQILVEAKFVEVSKDFTKSLGLKWGEIKATGSGYDDNISTGIIRFVENAGNDYRGDQKVVGAPVSDTYNPFNLGNLNRLNTIGAMIEANQGNSNAKVLSSPRILTLSGTEADLRVGGQVPVTTVGKDGNPVTEWKDYGIYLKIKPTVDEANKIRADIETEVSELDYASADRQGNPGVKNKRANTVVYINNKDTIVISGLITNTKSKQKTGIPYLMDIPVLGKLFQSQNWVEKKSELLIFLTPKLVRKADKEVMNPPIKAEIAGHMDTSGASSRIIDLDKRLYEMGKSIPVGSVGMDFAYPDKPAKKAPAAKAETKAPKAPPKKAVAPAVSARTSEPAKVMRYQDARAEVPKTPPAEAKAMAPAPAEKPVDPVDSGEDFLERQRRIRGIFKKISSSKPM